MKDNCFKNASIAIASEALPNTSTNHDNQTQLIEQSEEPPISAINALRIKVLITCQ